MDKNLPAVAGFSLPQYLTQDQLAARLQRSRRTISNMRKRGDLPFIKLGGGVLFDPEAVSQALARRTVNVSRLSR